ncbi:hypothetical protein HDU97_002156 [Phlyctochytrium planicorne]|nr:hypothetical protein HDU97_002156 [Phlyctochytrium planicorne]
MLKPFKDVFGREVLSNILVATGDINLCIKVECMLNNLPSEHKDPITAFTKITPSEATFPASIHLLSSDPFLAIQVAEHGTVATLAWLHKYQSKSFNFELCDVVARGGSVKMAKLLVRKRCKKFSDMSLEYAILNGDMEMVEYLHKEVGVNLTAKALRKVAKIGSLELAEYFDNWEDASQNLLGQLFHESCIQGHLDIVKSLINHRKFEYLNAQTRFQTVIAECDHINIIECLLEFVSPISFFLQRPAENGNIQLLRYFSSKIPVEESKTTHAFYRPETFLDKAARNGHLECVKFLHTERKEECGEAAFNNAISGNHFDVASYIIDAQPPNSPVPQEWYRKALNASCLVGNLAMVKKMSASFTGCTKESLLNACHKQHLDIAKFLIESRGSEIITIAVLDTAAGTGSLPMVQYLHRLGAQCTHAALDMAATYGHLEVVKYLHSERTEGCTTKAMDGAAGNGFLDVVTFLNENRTEGCTTKAMNSASANNHLPVVRYLQENRSEGATKEAMSGAISSGHLEVVKYLHQHRTEGYNLAAIDDAAANNHLEVIQFVLENRQEGCLNSAMDRAAGNGHMEVIEYLNKTKPNHVSSQAILRAAENGHLEAVKFLHGNRSEGNIKASLDVAIKAKQEEVIKYLNQHKRCKNKCAKK